MTTIGVIGAGAWGTALSVMLANEERDVLLFGRDPEVVEEINTYQTNSGYLPGCALPSGIVATEKLDEVAKRDVVLCVVPAQSFHAIKMELRNKIGADTRLVLCAKGIDRLTGKFLHELASDILPDERISALSGPSFAADVAMAKPTAVTLASHSLETAQSLAALLSSPVFRIYASDDLIGVEAGGALKNVLALAVGIARGLDLGASAEAALIARAFSEMSSVAMGLGGRSETLAGLSGLGDLILTCSGPQSRNFAYGVALARGEDLTNLPLAEGVATASMALKIANENSMSVPITKAIVDVLDNKLSPNEAVTELLSRPLRTE